MSIESQLTTLAKTFTTDEIILAGGLAVYLNRNHDRQTSDIDIISLGMRRRDITERLYDIGTRVDVSFKDNIVDSLNLSDDEALLYQATRVTRREGRELRYFGPEMLIVTKLTSLSISGDPDQPSEYGLKVLRDKDLRDIEMLSEGEVDSALVYKLLEKVPALEENDPKLFYAHASRALNERSITFRRNAYGVGRVMSIVKGDKQESIYTRLLQQAAQHSVPTFARLLDQTYQEVIYGA